jgi:hypothetical protein
MENNTISPLNAETNELTLNTEALSYLNGIRKWAKFFAILGFVGIGLMVIFALTIGTIFEAINDSMYNQSMPMPTMILSIIYLFFAGLYFYPAYSLFKFSTEMDATLKSNDSHCATVAFKYLNNHFQFIGVMTIIIMSLYVLAFIFGTLMAGLF